MSELSSKWPTEPLVRKLRQGTEGQRRKVQEYLRDGNHLNAAELREQLWKELAKQDQEAGDEKMRDRASGVRSWLLNALALASVDDKESLGRLEKLILNPQEHHECRYFALEGLVREQAPGVTELAQKLLQDEALDVRALALVFLASKGEQGCDRLLRQQLKAGKPEEPLLAPKDLLRALGVVPVRGTTGLICGFIGGDCGHDALRALCASYADDSGAAHAIRALVYFIEKHSSTAYDASKAKALEALGRLKAQEAVPVVLREITDASASVAAAAAQALANILESRPATRRIVEKVCEGDEWEHAAYVNALRVMPERLRIVEELESLMLSGSVQQQEVARRLLYEMGGAEALQKLRTRAASDFLKAMEAAEQKVEDSFNQSILEARSGHRQATWMSWTMFVLGVILLFGTSIAVVTRLVLKEDMPNLAALFTTSGIGLFSTLYGLLVDNPRKVISEATSQLMQLKVIFLVYLRQLHQTDQAFTRRLMEEQPLRPSELADYNRLAQGMMEEALRMLSMPVNATSKPADTKNPAPGAQRTEAEAEQKPEPQPRPAA